MRHNRKVFRVLPFFLALALLLSQRAAFAQAEIVAFSKMLDVQELADSSEMKDKKYPSLDNVVRAMRSYPGIDGKKAYTMFVPNNEAFKKVPQNTIAYFIQSENKKALDELVSFHVVEGNVSYKDLEDIATKGGGKATLKTISGFKITVKLGPKKSVILVNEAGKEIHITASNWRKGNGVVHVVDSVIIPYDHGLGEEELQQANLKD